MNLFYSNTEKLLFWIPEYQISSNDIDEIIENLTNLKKEFLEYRGSFKIETFVITEPGRYKYMRVLYRKTDEIPEQAFEIGEKWTMRSWIEF